MVIIVRLGFRVAMGFRVAVLRRRQSAQAEALPFVPKTRALSLPASCRSNTGDPCTVPARELSQQHRGPAEINTLRQEGVPNGSIPPPSCPPPVRYHFPSDAFSLPHCSVHSRRHRAKTRVNTADRSFSRRGVPAPLGSTVDSSAWSPASDRALFRKCVSTCYACVCGDFP